MKSLEILLDEPLIEIVIVAVEGQISEEWVQHLKQKHKPSYCVELIILWAKPHMGPSHYRNIGAKATTSDIVLFLDYDCCPVPGLVNAHLKQYLYNDVGAVIGVTELRPINGSLFEETLLLSIYTVSFSFAKTQSKIDWGPSSNMSVRRDIVISIPFDEKFPVKGGGEDVDICWRIGKAGYIIRGAGNAIVLHDIWHPWHNVLKRLFRWGCAEGHLLIKYPERASYFRLLNYCRTVGVHNCMKNIKKLVFLLQFNISYFGGASFKKIISGRIDLLPKQIDWSNY